jgi:hypothetical protein
MFVRNSLRTFDRTSLSSRFHPCTCSQILLCFDKDLATFSSTSGATDTEGAEGEAKPKARRRRRHRFRTTTDDIPSFQDFQQQVKVRSLFRQFLRLTSPIASEDVSSDLRAQIRREFRANTGNQLDQWDIKRALSEGGKRLKELSAMLHSIPMKKSVDNDAVSTQEKPEESQWPWQSDKPRAPPLRFPSKSS